MFSQRHIAVIFAVAVVLGLPASASAAGWTSPVAAGPDGAVAQPDVAVNDRGDVYVAWVDGLHVNVSKRPAGGQFEPPQVLDPTSTRFDSEPDIAVDGAGNAVVTWYVTGSSVLVNNIPPPTIAQAFRGANDSSFGTPSIIDGPATGVGPPHLAANATGQTVLAWRHANDLHVASGTVSNVVAEDHTYPDTATPDEPSVAINSAGDAAAAWETTGGSQPLVHAAYQPRNGSFGTLETLPNDYFGPAGPTVRVAVDSAGRATAIWRSSDFDGVILGADRPAASQTWAEVPPQELGNVPTHADVFFDAQDAAVETWILDGVNGAVRPSSAPGSAFPGSTQLAPASENPSEKVMGGSPQGITATLWSQGADPSVALRGIVRPNGGPFGSPQTISEPGHSPDQPAVAVDSRGSVAAVWVDTSDGSHRIKHAEYDAISPTVTATVPANGTSGAAVSMSAAANDDWSKPSVTWDFGDGGTGSGDSVSHTYAAGGTYTVTVTATDGGGNVASTSSRITVAQGNTLVPKEGETFVIGPAGGTSYYTVPKSAANGKATAGPAVKRVPSRLRPPRGYTPWRRLTKDRIVPVKSLVDATKGTVKMVTAGNANSSLLYDANFSKGAFQASQPKSSSLTTLTMKSGDNFKRLCRGSSKKLRKAARRPRRRLFGSGRGRFRTRGRHSSATVRGTRWEMTDTCAGTLTVVRQGVVSVFDRVKKKNVTLRAGQRYLARPKNKRRRR